MEIKVNKNQTRTAIYVRISTAQQKTDRQVVELKEYAKSHAITIDADDIFIDVISGFKNGEIRPQYSVLNRRSRKAFMIRFYSASSVALTASRLIFSSRLSTLRARECTYISRNRTSGFATSQTFQLRLWYPCWP